ncbi:MAG: hypothetical protein O9296_16600 [Novosphingobium sp.]|jgi:hypothetical protein|nr:hypothetical protein [Novosphingobium sp.]
MEDPRQALIEARLERAAEAIGDPTQQVMSEFYRRFPDAKASFIHHAPHDPAKLEEEMVGNCLYYVMQCFISPIETRIYFDTSVPHHRVALNVPPDWFRGMIEAFIDVIEIAAPEHSSDESDAWSGMRQALVGLVERNRDI